MENLVIGLKIELPKSIFKRNTLKVCDNYYVNEVLACLGHCWQPHRQNYANSANKSCVRTLDTARTRTLTKQIATQWSSSMMANKIR